METPGFTAERALEHHQGAYRQQWTKESTSSAGDIRPQMPRVCQALYICCDNPGPYSARCCELKRKIGCPLIA